MALPWKSYMEGRVQDREIRKFMDGLTVPAYGGMWFRNQNPPGGTIGTTPEKQTVFDTSLPFNDSPLGVVFDQANSEIIPSSGGVYHFNVYADLDGTTGQIYTYTVYADLGSGPEPGFSFPVLTPGADPFASKNRDFFVRVNSGWKFSLWVNADAAGVTYKPYELVLKMHRIGPELPDAVSTQFPAVQAAR